MKNILILIALVFTIECHAQVYEPFTQMFWNHYSTINPAATGLFYKHLASATFQNIPRKFYDKYPWSLKGSYDIKLNKFDNGLGVDFKYEDYSIYKNYYFLIRYAYHLKLSEKSSLSGGISLGRNYYSIDYSDLYTIYPGDPMLDNGIETEGYYNIAAGLIYKYKWFNAGLSSRRIFGEGIKINDKFKEYPIYLTGSADIPVSRVITLQPHVFYMFSFNEYNFNLTGYYKKWVWLGFSYCDHKLRTVMTGVDLWKKYRIGYAYTREITNSAYEIDVKHEIVLSVMIPENEGSK